MNVGINTYTSLGPTTLGYVYGLIPLFSGFICDIWKITINDINRCLRSWRFCGRSMKMKMNAAEPRVEKPQFSP